jgi:hypothetical protein
MAMKENLREELKKKSTLLREYLDKYDKELEKDNPFYGTLMNRMLNLQSESNRSVDYLQRNKSGI